MDPKRFDALTRSHVASASRRRAIVSAVLTAGSRLGLPDAIHARRSAL